MWDENEAAASAATATATATAAASATAPTAAAAAARGGRSGVRVYKAISILSWRPLFSVKKMLAPAGIVLEIHKQNEPHNIIFFCNHFGCFPPLRSQPSLYRFIFLCFQKACLLGVSADRSAYPLPKRGVPESQLNQIH